MAKKYCPYAKWPDGTKRTLICGVNPILCASCANIPQQYGCALGPIPKRGLSPVLAGDQPAPRNDMDKSRACLFGEHHSCNMAGCKCWCHGRV